MSVIEHKTLSREEDARGLELSTYVKVPRERRVRDLEFSKPHTSTSTVIQKLPILDTQNQSTLCTRMSPAKLYYMTNKLNDDQHRAVQEIGFGALLTLGFGELFPKLSLWLVQNFDPYSCTLYLQDGKINIDAEDVHLTLGLPMGAKVVKEAEYDHETEEFSELQSKWRNVWDLKIGSPATSQMCDKILNLGYEDDFKRNFVVFVVSSCLNGHKGAKCNYKILFSLMKTSEISQFNWCQYTIQNLVDVVLCWRENPGANFKGFVLFLMLFYFDRVEFIGGKGDRKVDANQEANSFEGSNVLLDGLNNSIIGCPNKEIIKKRFNSLNWKERTMISKNEEVAQFTFGDDTGGHAPRWVPRSCPPAPD